MPETPPPTRIATPQPRRVDRWVLQAWSVAVGTALLWALLR